MHECDSGKGIQGFSFVQTGLNPTAQCRFILPAMVKKRTVLALPTVARKYTVKVMAKNDEISRALIAAAEKNIADLENVS
ncbi:hypothetical protein [Citrobacter sp. wls710]|uniref:hypothetical protein n=1 Tax=Citrobacter sp. wls710 TaxID=2576426 RepID=UPI0010C98AE4|nr:hypothetical protein [Citrobacter sp. wls710]